MQSLDIPTKVAFNDATMQRIRDRGPFLSLSDAAKAIRDVVGLRRLKRLNDPSAKQVALQMIARKLLALVPSGLPSRADEIVKHALAHGGLHPAILAELVAQGPFPDRIILQERFQVTLERLAGGRARPSAVLALIDDLVSDGVLKIASAVPARTA